MVSILRFDPFAIVGDELSESVEREVLVERTLDELFASVEGDFATACADVAVVGVGHFTDAVDDASHDANFEAFEVSEAGFDLCDGGLNVIERASAARA